MDGGPETDGAVLREHGAVGALVVADAEAAFVMRDKRVVFGGGHSGEGVNVEIAIGAVADCFGAGHAVPVGGTGRRDTDFLRHN